MNLIKSMLIKQLDMFINSIINSTETVFSCKTHLLLMSTWGSKKKKKKVSFVFDLIGLTYI